MIRINYTYGAGTPDSCVITISRRDTGETLVSATAMTPDGGDAFHYDLMEPEPGLIYDYIVTAVLGGSTTIWHNYAVGTTNLPTPGTLADIRRRVIDDSGHYELVVDAASGDYTDNGCNRHINDAQRWLDRKLQHSKGQGWLYKGLPAGESLVTFNHSRYVKEVWVALEDGERYPLDKVGLAELRIMYPGVALSSLERGAPRYYAPAPIGLAPEHGDTNADDLNNAGLADHDLLVFGNHWPYQGLIIMPPADTKYTVEVLAEWRSAPLVNDSDVSYWTVQHPELLVRATRLQFEIDKHRNTQGQNDFVAPVLDALRDIYHGLISEEMAGPPSRFVMRG